MEMKCPRFLLERQLERGTSQSPVSSRYPLQRYNAVSFVHGTKEARDNNVIYYPPGIAKIFMKIRENGGVNSEQGEAFTLWRAEEEGRKVTFKTALCRYVGNTFSSPPTTSSLCELLWKEKRWIAWNSHCLANNVHDDPEEENSGVLKIEWLPFSFAPFVPLGPSSVVEEHVYLFIFLCTILSTPPCLSLSLSLHVHPTKDEMHVLTYPHESIISIVFFSICIKISLSLESRKLPFLCLATPYMLQKIWVPLECACSADIS